VLRHDQVARLIRHPKLRQRSRLLPAITASPPGHGRCAAARTAPRAAASAAAQVAWPRSHSARRRSAGHCRAAGAGPPLAQLGPGQVRRELPAAPFRGWPRTLARLAAWPLVSGQSASGGSLSRVAGAISGGTRSALDSEGKHVTIQGPSPDLTSSFSEIMRRCATLPWGRKLVARGCGSRVAGVRGAGGGRRGGRCIVALSCCRSSPFPLGPFEAVFQIGAGAPWRVTPVAAACACVSLLY
jgi:hypothetical protein